MSWRRFLKPLLVALALSLLLPPAVMAIDAHFREGFEGGVVPPAGWTLKTTNAAATWKISTWLPHGGSYDASCPATAQSKGQNEVLISRYLYFQGCPDTATLTFWSMGAKSCRHDSGNTCDLKVWLVRNRWDGGKKNDILLGKAEGDWTTDWAWAQSTFTLKKRWTRKPFRIAFQYRAPQGVSKAPIYLDDIDVTGCHAQLIQNWIFEDGPAIPAHWQGVNLGPKDRRVCKVGRFGPCSFRMRGSKANKALKQTVNIPGGAGYSFYLDGWSKAQGPNPGGGPYCLEAKVFHKDGTKKRYRAHFNKTTHDWEGVGKAFTTAKPFNKIEIYLRYANQTGRAWFDWLHFSPRYQ